MVSLRFFGPPRIEGEEGPLNGRAAQRHRLGLLALLSAAPGHQLSRDKLLAYLWPDADARRARHLLNVSVHVLRRELGEGALASIGDNVRLDPEIIRSDVAAFETAIAEGDAERAVELYTAPFLDGFHLNGSTAFERWLNGERARLAGLYERALESLATEAEAAEDVEAAVEWWRRLAVHNPYSGRIAARLMRALEAAGDHGAAIRHAVAHEALLREELRAEPDPEVVTLTERLRTEPSRAPTREGNLAEPDDAAPASRVRVSAGEAQKRSRARFRWGLGSLAIVAVLALAVLLIPRGTLRPEAEPSEPDGRSTPTLDPNRVLIAPFENETGDSELDVLGRIAADWVTEGLAKTGLVEVVDSRVVLYSLQALEADTDLPLGQPLSQALAQLTGAGKVVWGSYYRQGDSLMIRAQVTDASDGTLLRVVQSSSGVDAEPMQVADELRTRVMGALATLLDGRLASQTTASSAVPTYGAYREFTEGMERFARHHYGEALPFFYRAASLDSTFILPLLWASEAHRYDTPTDWFHADSLIRLVEKSRGRLSPVDRHGLDYLTARQRGDRAAARDALNRASELAPQSYWSFQLASDEWLEGRFTEALEALEAFDPAHGWVRSWRRYWWMLTGAYHSLGEYGQEREAALGGQEAFPDAPHSYGYELRALAALGEVDEVVAGVEGMIDRFGEGWAVGAMQALIPELRAHGFPDASRALAERCIERINELVVTLSPEEVREKGYVPYHLGACSRWAGRPAQARTLYEEALAADDFPPWDRKRRYVARLSILAAERGDRAEADRYLQEYLQEITGSPRPEGAPADGQEPPGLLTQAKIAALLGEREQALAFLGRHVAGRTAMREQLHRMIEFESLWDDPEFEELIRPRD